MTPERFRQVRNLFEAALEREPDGRPAFVAEAVASDEELHVHVLRMLGAHERKVTFLDGALTAPADLRTDPRRMEGRRLGPFEILCEIGRGGMGTVYLARRADGMFEQRVAIKVVTPETGTEEMLRRFEQERAILATLEHPNIARIYDGGTTQEGWPYFVMEYVDGVPIDSWCDERRLNIRDRTRLFRTICAAVHYAHRHGVIHRDLKPGNILVTGDGTVKLLDFGIAKLVRAETRDRTLLATRTRMFLMTPEYASPEQLQGEQTTPLTDVYSLGVILYELLTGRRPYRLKSRIFHEIVRVVCEERLQPASAVVTESYEEPAVDGHSTTVAPGMLSATREGTPIDLKRQLTGDLDSILSQALEKKPEERYRSCEQLSSDLERHLLGKPILASRSGTLNQVARFVSRHRVLLVLGAGVAMAFASGAIRIELAALVYIGAAVSLLGLCIAATNQKVGAFIYSRPKIIGVLAVILIMAAGFYWLRFKIADERGARTAFAVLQSLFLMMSAGLAIHWARRSRWAGELLMSRKFKTRHRFFSVLLTVGLIDMLYALIHHYGMLPRDALQTAFFATSILYVRFIVSRFEIRDRGILFHGDFISWLEMEGYSWEGPWRGRQPLFYRRLPDGTECLRLPRRRSASFLKPYVRIPILPEDKAIVETLVKQNLSPVPIGGNPRPDSLRVPIGEA